MPDMYGKPVIQDVYDVLDRYLAENVPFFKKAPEGIYQDILNNIDKVIVIHFLKRKNGNQLSTCRDLGINRNTLRKHIKTHGIDVRDYIK